MVKGDANPNIIVAIQIQLQKLQQQNEIGFSQHDPRTIGRALP